MGDTAEWVFCGPAPSGPRGLLRCPASVALLLTLQVWGGESPGAVYLSPLRGVPTYRHVVELLRMPFTQTGSRGPRGRETHGSLRPGSLACLERGAGRGHEPGGELVSGGYHPGITGVGSGNTVTRLTIWTTRS